MLRSMQIYRGQNDLPARAGLAAFFFAFSLSSPLGSTVLAANAADAFLEAVDKIVKSDRELEAEEASIQSEEAQLRALRGAVLPNLSLSAARSKRLTTFNKEPWGNTLGLDASLNLFRFGEDSARWSEADARESQYEQQRFSLRFEAENRASRLLQEFWSSAQELRTTSKIRELRQRLLDVGERQYQRGLLSLQEKQKIQLDRQSIELDFTEAQRRLASARLALDKSVPSVSASTSPSFWPENWPWLASGLELKVDWLKESNSSHIKEVVEQHPRLRAASASLNAAQAKTRQLWAAQAPSLDFSTTHKQPVTWNMREQDTIFTLALTIPLLQGLGPSSAYRSQQESSSAEQLRLEKLRRDLSQELEQQLESLRVSWQSLHARASIVTTARSLYEAGLRRFEQGLISVNELSNDETRLYSYETDLNEALSQFHGSLVGYCQAYGLTFRHCLKKIQ